MNNRRKIKVSSALAGLLIIFSVMALMTVPAFAAQSASATRDVQTQTLAPGGSTTVTVTIANNVSQSLSLDEDIPVGWTLTRGVDDADTFKLSTSEWVWFSVAAGATKTVTYTLTVASDATAGDYSISGAISNVSGVIDTVKGEDTVTVEVAPTPKSANATRDIQTQTLAPSDSTTVTVTIANNVSQALSLDEDIPAGWTLTRGVDDADAFKPSTSEWVWFSVAAGATETVTYTLTVAGDATAGDYSISGAISNASGVIDTVKGEDTVTVTAPDTTPPTWDTTVGIQSATDMGLGGQVTVTYGTATDADSPPVKYNVYYNTVSPATAGIELSNVGPSPYTVAGLTNGQLYYFTVRVEDSATPPNEDTNTVELVATPTAPTARTVEVWAEPPTVAPGNISEIVATVMEDGTPLEGITVTFETDFGGFTESRGGSTCTVETNERGIAIAHFYADTEGTATITATEPTGASNNTQVIVASLLPRTVSLSAEPSTVAPGNVSEITATVMEDGTPLGGITVTFETDFGGFTESRGGSTCTVETNESGIAIAHFYADTEGTANITATEPNGVSNTTVVAVSAGPLLATITVEPETAQLNVSEQKQFTATAYDQKGDVMPDIVFTWSSSNETVGTVNETTGLFTALAGGTTTVTAYNASVGLSVNGTAVVTVSAGLPKTGDMDGDGEVTFADVIALAMHYYFEDTVYADPDVNSDGEVTFDDVILLAKHYYFGDQIYP